MDARYHDDRHEGPPEDACINDGRRSSGWGTGTTMMARTMPDSSGPTMVRRHRDHHCGMMDKMATGRSRWRRHNMIIRQHSPFPSSPPPPPPPPRRVPPPLPSRFPQSGINPKGGGGAATTTTVTLGVYLIRLSVILMRYIIRKATKKK